MSVISHPVFSVVIPTYNRKSLVSRAIRSVMAQSFGDFELLVVDDHSTEDFGAVAESIGDSRIRYIRRGRNGGNAATRNTGVQNACGDLIAFLDDDDEYMPDFLGKTYAYLRNAPNSIGFSWCGTEHVLDTQFGEQVLSQETWQPSFDNREDAYLSFLQSRKIGTNCGITIRRSCFDSIGMFDESLRKAVDTDFLIRLAREFDFIAIPDVLIRVHDHDGSRVRTNYLKGAEAYEIIMEKHIEKLRTHPKVWSAKHYKTAWLYYYGGNKAKARYHMGQAVRMNFSQPKYWMTWFLLEMFDQRGLRFHSQISAWKKRFLAGMNL